MPLWLWLAGGAGLLWWLNSRHQVQVAIPPGAATYKIVAGGADYFTSDPSLLSKPLVSSSWASDGLNVSQAMPVTKAGSLAAGAVVYSTTSGSPQLSADQSYELVLAPGVGQVWVSIASILAQ